MGMEDFIVPNGRIM